MPQKGWYAISKLATAALLHVVRLPSCRKLVLDNVLFPYVHLLPLTQLRHLKLASRRAISQNTATNDVALALPTQLQFLETLKIEFGDRIAHTRDELQSLSIERLLEYRLRIHTDIVEPNQRLFDLGSASLVRLDVEFSTGRPQHSAD
ncbi:hypothetical protein H0H81_012682 [Sphagnurus paluster]|uniref:Uncharacterized protein n=1 Tax=Sphagnurus paluster TaxID=117069 RepID=A0A9P7K363_9AGAR|nr:hypothetical protein H0H81_012682 [Sphagnurus paluster]